MSRHYPPIVLAGVLLAVSVVGGVQRTEVTGAVLDTAEQPGAIAALLYWDVGGEKSTRLRCVARKDSEGGQRLTCEREGKEVVSLAEGDQILGLFPTRDLDGHLVTLWTSGSAYKIVVLAVKDGRGCRVLEAGSRKLPELVYEPEADHPTFLVARLAWSGVGSARRLTEHEADVWAWRGQKYELRARVPWMKRFEAIAKGRIEGSR